MLNIINKEEIRDIIDDYGLSAVSKVDKKARFHYDMTIFGTLINIIGQDNGSIVLSGGTGLGGYLSKNDPQNKLYFDKLNENEELLKLVHEEMILHTSYDVGVAMIRNFMNIPIAFHWSYTIYKLNTQNFFDGLIKVARSVENFKIILNKYANTDMYVKP